MDGLSSSLPHADSVNAAVAVSASAASRVGRRFTVGSRWGEASHQRANAIQRSQCDTRAIGSTATQLIPNWDAEPYVSVGT
ncbi:hypothetical protein GCM10018789_25330 [Streptomyces werraensis]|nr:hypothetical protein GCM10018789_25330 [Streptomyces werraensis]